MKLTKRKLAITLMAGVLGLLLTVQSKSIQKLNDLTTRDDRSNTFESIIVLKAKNDSLEKEIKELEGLLVQVNDQGMALEAVNDEIEKYNKLTGGVPVFGPGLQVIIDGKLSTPWLIDIINELLNSGAEAVAVNGIRLTNETIGFDTLPQGQILLNGSILTAPYEILAIGDGSVMQSAINISGGIIDRFKKSSAGSTATVTTKEVIKMN